MTRASRANLYNLSRFFAFVVLFVAQAIVLDWLVSSIKEMIPVHGVRRSRNEKGRKGTFLIMCMYLRRQSYVDIHFKAPESTVH